MMAKTARIKAPSRAQAHVASGPSFLGLPLEVRIMIYSLLLVADKPLGCERGEGIELEWASSGEYHLQPAILRVCWQLHQEASPILNRENTFGIQIYGYDFPAEFAPKSLFMNFELYEGMPYLDDLPPFEEFQRVEIVIDAAGLDLEKGEEINTNLCSYILCNMPALQHISLCLLYPYIENHHVILAPFGVLRNIRSVLIEGPVPLLFEERLEELMLGNTPRENGKNMYLLLEKYVNVPKGDLSHLEEASKALQELDFQKFKEIRSRILLDCQRRMEDALLHVFDHDPKEVGISSRRGRRQR